MALKDLTEEDYKNIINMFNTEPIPAWQSLRVYITTALDEGRLDAQVKPANGGLSEIKSIVEDAIKDIDDDARYHYKPATIFDNAPLALHQTAQEAKMTLLKSLQKEIESRLSV